MQHVTSDKWQVTCDLWLVTYDTLWGGGDIFSRFQLPSSYGFGRHCVVKIFPQRKTQLITEIIIHKGVCRTALAKLLCSLLPMPILVFVTERTAAHFACKYESWYMENWEEGKEEGRRWNELLCYANSSPALLPRISHANEIDQLSLLCAVRQGCWLVHCCVVESRVMQWSVVLWSVYSATIRPTLPWAYVKQDDGDGAVK